MAVNMMDHKYLKAAEELCLLGLRLANNQKEVDTLKEAFHYWKDHESYYYLMARMHKMLNSLMPYDWD